MQDPIVQFNSWMEDAKRAGIDEPTAMALATADLQGLPSVRMVLLKHADEHGFVFYTNLESAKAAQLKVNPQAELCFYFASDFLRYFSAWVRSRKLAEKRSVGIVFDKRNRFIGEALG